MESEHLTQRNDSGGITCDNVTAALEKLAAYEDAEEQGRLVRLPVQVGQTVYVIVNPSINIIGITPCLAKATVCSVEFKDNRYPRRMWSFYTDGIDSYYHGSEIGKTVFLTRAEAEAALQAQDAARPRADGEWRESGDGFFDFVYCSVCGHKELRETSLPPLCPVCGARMAQ